ncbi:hypothetical protein [Modicisalibacter luteus]|uniref:Uncharacterized protein n=1 Tax=Modicisalibacter luteus TaxID=453962 RepID=A0ABV7M0E9_9GAMM|nr:hypothetical protein [Halomonas lutea]GHA95037.1 hypothetical protein GCM10007159_15570 [Halomonas lutea]
MNTTNLNLPKLSMLGASLLVTGMLSGSIVMANESASGSATGSGHGHSTTSGGGTSSHGSMHMDDCPDDLKEGDECPEGWKPEGSGQNMPEQGSDSYGGEGGSGGMDTGTGTGTGGSATGGSTGGGSGSSSGTGTAQ